MITGGYQNAITLLLSQASASLGNRYNTAIIIACVHPPLTLRKIGRLGRGRIRAGYNHNWHHSFCHFSVQWSSHSSGNFQTSLTIKQFSLTLIVTEWSIFNVTFASSVFWIKSFNILSSLSVLFYWSDFAVVAMLIFLLNMPRHISQLINWYFFREIAISQNESH